MSKVFVNETVEVNKPRDKRFFESIILGNFNEWIAKKIAPTLLANKKKYADKYTR